MFFWMVSKALLQLLQSTLMKRSMTEFGRVLRPFLPVFQQGQFAEFFGDEIMPKKSPMNTYPVASNNISKNRLVHRRYPLVHFDKV